MLELLSFIVVLALLSGSLGFIAFTLSDAADRIASALCGDGWQTTATPKSRDRLVARAVAVRPSTRGRHATPMRAAA